MKCQRCQKELKSYEVNGDPGECLCWHCNQYLKSPPRLIKCDSVVVTCASCGAWLDRYPEFLDGDYSWQCERCGSTSINTRKGRVYGPKSRQWDFFVKEFEKMAQYVPLHWVDGIQTDPPVQAPDRSYTPVEIYIKK